MLSRNRYCKVMIKIESKKYTVILERYNGNDDLKE